MERRADPMRHSRPTVRRHCTNLMCSSDPGHRLSKELVDIPPALSQQAQLPSPANIYLFAGRSSEWAGRCGQSTSAVDLCIQAPTYNHSQICHWS
ncbi:hypothetical protein BDZ91DRAFT_112795 [Kalaharituber pfeilii]|nr:hypothetical protein BDZ91DRAFT_112795 [Kalaharituber pfeilii]